MLNIFLINGLIWLLILVLYLLKWSDLCINLSPGLLFFISLIIVSSFIFAFIFRKYFCFRKLKRNPHKKPKGTIIILLLYAINFIYSGSLPLFAVLGGNSMASANFKPLPLFFALNAINMFYCWYLFYIFLCFRKKRVIMELFLLLMMTLLLYQRQYLIFSLMGFLVLILSSLIGKPLKIRYKFIILFAVVVVALIGLYFFGIIGNSRYGLWDKNDSSMILELGKINSNFPSWIPKEYAWTYVYLTSPLANLQYNYELGISPNSTLFGYFLEFIPNFISKYFSYETLEYVLIEPSLNVCTAYTIISLQSGIIGMVFFYIIQLSLCAIIVKKTYKSEMFVPICIALFYFLAMSFFDNPFRFETTAMMIFISVFFIIKKKIVFRI